MGSETPETDMEFSEGIGIQQKPETNYNLDGEKNFDEKLGIEFETPTISPIKRCRNHCIFCFISQMPKGMRESLYVKDDDYRLSPFYGNYVTLTNLSDKEIDRLIKYRVSPIYISIHTTNGKIREEMLSNPKASNITSIIRKLKEAGIEMHGQIVLCPGINDGDELNKTITDLIEYYPELKSLAVVPVGLTKYRDGLTPLASVSGEDAIEVINQIELYQKAFLNQFGTRFVFLADEFYLLAGQDFPDYDSYEDFLQIDNGVGLVKKFETEALNYIEDKDLSLNNINGSIISGKLGAIVINKMLNRISTINKIGKIDIDVIPIKNDFFGSQVTVTGLVTGKDIITQLKDHNLKSAIMIPEVMLKDGGDLFLDNYSLDQVQNELDKEVIKVPVSGKNFVQVLQSLSEGDDRNDC